MFLGKGVKKLCRKFTGEHVRWSAILIKLHFCMSSSVNLLYIFRTLFPKNIFEGLPVIIKFLGKWYEKRLFSGGLYIALTNILF